MYFVIWISWRLQQFHHSLCLALVIESDKNKGTETSVESFTKKTKQKRLISTSGSYAVGLERNRRVMSMRAIYEAEDGTV